MKNKIKFRAKKSTELISTQKNLLRRYQIQLIHFLFKFIVLSVLNRKKLRYFS